MYYNDPHDGGKRWDWWNDDPKDEEDGKKDEKRRWWSGGDSFRRGGSLSGWWSESVGGIKSWWKSSKTGDYAKALRSVRRVGSIIYGKKLHFSWQETSSNKDVTLNPSPLKATANDEWNEGRLADALIGDAISRAGHLEYVVPENSSYKTHIASEAQKIAMDSGRPNLFGLLTEVGVQLFNVADWLMAGRAVTKEFPGYTGYFEAERAFHQKNPTQPTLHATTALGDDDRHIMGIVTKALWDALAPAAGSKADGSPEVPFLDLPLPEGRPSPETMKEIEEVTAEIRRIGLTDPRYIIEEVNNLLRRVAEYTIPDNPESAKDTAGQDWRDLNDEGEQRKAARSFGMASRGSDEVALLADSEAIEVENLVEMEYDEDNLTPSGRPGNQYGDRSAKIKHHLAAKHPSRYTLVLKEARPLIARTRAALTFRNEAAASDELRLRRGYVDEGGIHRIAQGDMDVFRRTEIVDAPEVAVGILVDESGSMAGGYNRTKIEVAQACATIIYEACRGLRGVETSVWGHSTSGRSVEMLRYIEPGYDDPSRLGSMMARSENSDGYALKWTGERLLKVSRDSPNKVLFFLLDGYPSGPDYGGNPALDHVRQVTNELRQKGVEVFAIGTGTGVDSAALHTMFGKRNSIMVPDPNALPREMSKLLTRALRFGQVA